MNRKKGQSLFNTTVSIVTKNYHKLQCEIMNLILMKISNGVLHALLCSQQKRTRPFVYIFMT